MEWLAQLLKASCSFCRTPLPSPWRSTDHACVDCAQELVRLCHEPAQHITVGEIQAIAAVRYEAWAKDLILRQKKQLKAPVIRVLADLLWLKMPKEWRGLPLVYVPGSPLSEMHLVEALALELARHGLKLVTPTPLKRKLFAATRPQKGLDVEERKARDMRTRYTATRLGLWAAQQKRTYQDVLLLDDIITTGSTLTGCAHILEHDTELRVVGALAIAHTPRKFSATQPLSCPQYPHLAEDVRAAPHSALPES